MDLSNFLFNASPEIDWFQRILEIAEAIGVVVAAIAAFLAIRQTRVIHKEQVQLSRQQMFIPISDKLNNFRSINQIDPNWEHVVQALNLLELTVLVYKEHMVDRDMLLHMYGELYIEIFNEIYLARDLKTGERNGQQYLTKNTKGVIEFYRWLCKRYKKSDLTLAPMSMETETDNASRKIEET